MQPDERDAAYLWDMLDAAKAVRQFVANHTLDDYAADRMLRAAVERQIEIIGEAAGKVSKNFRETHPEVPWQRIIAQRHVLAHEYGDVDNRLIWKVVAVHLPDLIVALEPLVPSS